MTETERLLRERQAAYDLMWATGKNEHVRAFIEVQRRWHAYRTRNDPSKD